VAYKYPGKMAAVEAWYLNITEFINEGQAEQLW
jgi:hypothetical protein